MALWKPTRLSRTSTKERCPFHHQIRSDQIGHSVVSDSLWPHESQHTRPPCPSPTPGVGSKRLRRLDSLESTQWAPRDTRRDSRAELITNSFCGTLNELLLFGQEISMCLHVWLLCHFHFLLSQISSYCESQCKQGSVLYLRALDLTTQQHMSCLLLTRVWMHCNNCVYHSHLPHKTQGQRIKWSWEAPWDVNKSASEQEKPRVSNTENSEKLSLYLDSLIPYFNSGEVTPSMLSDKHTCFLLPYNTYITMPS